jgi:ABC-type polysaccharide/polyol phosphate export permease
MAVTGYIVGWRINTGFAEALGGFLLLLVFAYAFSWVMAWVGLLVPGPEVVQNAAFVVIFPLTFVANTFVPLATLPAPLQTFAEWNPVSAVTQAVRVAFGNIPPRTPVPDVWSLQHPALYTLIWAALFLIVFVPLSGRQYKRAVSR